MEKLKILNINNGEVVTRKFIEATIYDKFMIFNMEYIAEDIAYNLMNQKRNYGWDEIELDDIDCALENIIYEFQSNINGRVHEIFKKNNIKHEYPKE